MYKMLIFFFFWGGGGGGGISLDIPSKITFLQQSKVRKITQNAKS